jgi:ribosomal protein S18 acetylase RimI-like enzyme
MSIAILPGYRNQGLGTRMIKAIIAITKEDCPGVSLSVVESSPARRLYERLGFQTVGRVGDSLVMLLRWRDHE